MSQEKTCGANCGCAGAGPAVTAFLSQLGPSEEVQRHFRAAGIEFLKGIRQLLDDRIGDAPERTKPGARITVE